MNREPTETKTVILYAKCLTYVPHILDFQRLLGVVAGIVVQRQVIFHTERRARSHM